MHEHAVLRAVSAVPLPARTRAGSAIDDVNHAEHPGHAGQRLSMDFSDLRTHVDASGALIQRKCADNANEDFYKTAPNFCRDTAATGGLHKNQRCYREFPLTRTHYRDCPPGRHVCFDEKSGECDSHVDNVSPVASKGKGGYCRLHGQCSLEHVSKDDVIGEWWRGTFGRQDTATAPWDQPPERSSF